MNARAAGCRKPAVEHRDVTRLSDRDRDRFLALLDDADATPNAALVEAAAGYKKHLVD